MKIEGKTIKILSHEEILEKDDICRLIIETGENGGFDTTYKHEGFKPLEWQLAKNEMSGWIGEKINNNSYHICYEYARIIN